MIFDYNSRIESYKSPFGAIPAGDCLRLRITARDGVFIESIVLELKMDGGEVIEYPMPYSGSRGGMSEFMTTVQIATAGIYWYKFKARTELGVVELGRGTRGAAAVGSPLWFQQTVYQLTYRTPEDIKGGVIYHIFADRFNRGVDPSVYWAKSGKLKNWNEDVTIVDEDGVFRANDFYGGNLQGMIDKLDYIHSLGVTHLYLSPVFKSGSNHRYDTADYMQIDELLGSEEKFDELILAAKGRGIGIILDGVFNHTGADSVYFNKFGNYDSVGAYQGIQSPYFDWYYFKNFPEEYGCWWGITVTPTVNKRTDSYRQFIYGRNGVIDKWTAKGIAGWRLDVVDELEEDFVDDLSRAIKSHGDKVIIGEVWEDASHKIAYSTLRPYLLGWQLDGVMNYPFKLAVLEYCKHNAKDYFQESVMSIVENYPRQALNCCMTLIGTHDTCRAINALSGVDLGEGNKRYRLGRRLSNAERERARGRLKIASLLQYTLPGTPTVYYGDEIGMEGFEDPINRRPFTWDNMDEELLGHYRMLGELRKKYHDELVGETKVVTHEKLLIVARSSDKHTLIVVCNNGRDTAEYHTNGVKDALTGGKCIKSVLIAPGEYRLFFE